MSLLLTITKAPASVAIAESTKTIGAQGGTIGRGADNSWVLEDPERFLSSMHCQFSCEGGQYFITDCSTNGTFLNGAPQPMGKGVKQPLSDGDTFSLGDYELSVSLWNVAAQPEMQSEQPGGPFAGGAVPAEQDGFAEAQTPFADSVGENDLFASAQPAGANPFGGGIVAGADSMFPASSEETDPLAALDKAQGRSDPFAAQQAPVADPFAGASQPDNADPLNQQVSWPSAAPEQSPGMIPDDWDDDLSVGNSGAQSPMPTPTPGQRPAPGGRTAPAEPAAPTNQPAQPDADQIQQQVMAQANAKIQAELDILKQQIKTQQQQTGLAEITTDTSVVEAIGLGDKPLSDEQILKINETVGQVVRESVRGLMQVLSSRSSIKNEFRMNVTTIQPVENNPLKFSANVDDALENMFLKQGNAYKQPVEAVKDGFDGIAEHQLAILAGIRSAFKGVVDRFDPAVLEERFNRQKKGGIMPGSQKAKNWEMYNEYYQELVNDMDNSFQYLFGDEFVQAYEDQLRKLAIARKKSHNKD